MVIIKSTEAEMSHFLGGRDMYLLLSLFTANRELN